jgi:hypothetical protein
MPQSLRRLGIFGANPCPKENTMSKQVTISDVFYESLAETIRAVVEYAQNPESEDAEYNYLTSRGIYEYDTEIIKVIDNVVHEKLGY